jgi:hypothetical protein
MEGQETAPGSFWGVDVSSRALHAVAIDREGRLRAAAVLEPTELDDLADAVAGAAAIGVDAPDGWSRARHAADDRLPTKFRTARCGEIALRGDFGYSVPWPTPPAEAEHATWMEVGIDTHRRLSDATPTVEVFPHATFLHLAGRRSLPAKARVRGARVRAALLSAKLAVGEQDLALWSTDALDALAAALTARDVGRGRAVAARCVDHPQDSAIFLPAGGP